MKANFVCHKAQQLKLSLWVCSFACRTHQVSGVVTRTINAGFPCPKTLKYCIKRSILSAFNLGIFAYTWNLYLLYYVVVNCFCLPHTCTRIEFGFLCLLIYPASATANFDCVFWRKKIYKNIYIFQHDTKEIHPHTRAKMSIYFSNFKDIFYSILLAHLAGENYILSKTNENTV